MWVRAFLPSHTWHPSGYAATAIAHTRPAYWRRCPHTETRGPRRPARRRPDSRSATPPRAPAAGRAPFIPEPPWRARTADPAPTCKAPDVAMISLELRFAARLQMHAAAADCIKGTSGDLFPDNPAVTTAAQGIRLDRTNIFDEASQQKV